MNEKLNDAFSQIDDRHIHHAATYRSHRPLWIGAVAAVLILALCIGIWGRERQLPSPTVPIVQGTEPSPTPTPGKLQSPDTLTLANLVASPTYPQMVQIPVLEDYSNNYDAYCKAESAWREARNQQYAQPEDYADSLTPFFQKSIPIFLSGEENRVYSPLNVCLALSMLAEVTAGDTQQQVLDALGCKTLEQVRTQAAHIWNAHYCDDGQSTSLLANSLWLDSMGQFNPETVAALAQHYYASVFHGDLGAPELDEQLRQWLNSQTGGLLQDSIADITLPEETLFALASTAYFSAGFEEEFPKSKTSNKTFHCSDCDLITPFMENTLFSHTYYWSDHYGAVQLGLDGGSFLWIILPDEGTSLNTLMEQGDYLTMLLSPRQWETKKQAKIQLSIPKFDVNSDIDLTEGLKALGITHVFNEASADFSAMLSGTDAVLSKASHAGRVAIDEESVVAAAYTLLLMEATGAPDSSNEVFFTANRPFLFAITSHDNLPMFTGIVTNP